MEKVRIVIMMNLKKINDNLDDESRSDSEHSAISQINRENRQQVEASKSLNGRRSI